MMRVDHGISLGAGSVDVAVRQLDGDIVLVHIAGEVDLSTHRAVESALLDVLVPPSPEVLIADLSEVSFFDSSGINTLLDVHQHAQTVGTDFRVVSDQRAVRMPLTITGVDRYLNIYDDRESASQQPHSVPLTPQ